MVPRFEKRIRAFAIDTSAMAISLILTSLGMQETGAWQYVVLGVLFFVIYILPYIISSGQTFGKRIEKIKIVKLDGSNVNLFVVILREITKLALSVATFGLYMIIANFALTEKGVSRTIHDYIFKTKVIDLDTSVQNIRKNEIFTTDTMKKTRLDD